MFKSNFLKYIWPVIKQNIYLFILIFYCFVFLAVNIKMNLFRYNNFDYGKFDLGNMTQMVWNTMNGRFMYLTDHFGTNLPRWAMSHVDPILVFFVPVFYFFPHPLTLVFSQLLLVIFSSVVVYLIAKQHLKSDLSAFFIAMAYLFYPAVGFLTAWTGFHGVTAVMPFFFISFYIFEYMYKNNKFTPLLITLFFINLIILLTGKEQISLYVFLFGIFIIFFRQKLKLGLSVATLGLGWFILCFFVIIPLYANHRVVGYDSFTKELKIVKSQALDVTKSNFFLKRYEDFGDTYFEIGLNILLNPRFVIEVGFGGDKIENFTQTLAPLGYFPLLYPPLFVIAVPDFLINYLTTLDNIGTAEIVNHRISMIIPVLFISTIYFIGFLNQHFGFINVLIIKKLTFFKKYSPNFLVIFLSFLILILNYKASFDYGNPVYLWLNQAISKRISLITPVFAKSADDIEKINNLKVGERISLNPLEDKDRECALKIISSIPDNASVSGPDYMGAHLSMRETYAIFPGSFSKADYVIVDVFSQKILRTLDLDVSLIHDIVGRIIKDKNYKFVYGCGNLFVFKNVGPHGKSNLLPLQEYFKYEKTVDYEIFLGLNLVDFKLPKNVTKGQSYMSEFVYTIDGSKDLKEYVLFMTFVNTNTGEIYQSANLPSFGLTRIQDWDEEKFYKESLEIVFPEFLDAGTYKAFIGIDNNIRTRSIYLEDIIVK